MPGCYSWVYDTQHLHAPFCIVFRCAQLEPEPTCPGLPLGSHVQDRWQLGWKLSCCGWESSLSYVLKVRICYIIADRLLNLFIVIFLLRTWAICERSRPILVFLIGLSIVCTVAVFHMSYVLLTWLIGGLYSIRDCDGRAFRFQGWGSWYLASLRPSDGKRAIWHISLLTGASYITLVIEGIGKYQIPMISVKYAWVMTAPYLLVLVFQSGSSACLVSGLSSMSSLLTPCSRVGPDSVQTTTIPQQCPKTVEANIGRCSLGRWSVLGPWTLVAYLALADICIWLGIMYFVFMFSEYFFLFLYMSLKQIPSSCCASDRCAEAESLGESIWTR